MKWNKLGLLYQAPSINSYLDSHAANPLALHLKDDLFRVFFSGRNIEQKSSVGYVDINIHTQEIFDVCTECSFKFSPDPDSFYSHGVSIGNIYDMGSRSYVLFMAWQIRGNSHWRGDIGQLELGKNKKSFTLAMDQPFLTKDAEDPVSLSYPCVILDDDNYKMWYGSTISWDSPNGEMIHVIKYATSLDGLTWHKHGLAIPYELGVAQAFSRPSVIKDNFGYHMWFSFRSGSGETYRIGYAHSRDSINWERRDSGINISESGWDSEMICYPFVFDHKGRRYMLYNGNDFGKTGFGLAILEDS